MQHHDLLCQLHFQFLAAVIFLVNPIQLGFVLNDLLNNLERVGDHCSNIALSVIEEQTDEADSHAYVHSLKKDQEFNLRFQQDLKRYALPNEE